MGGGIRLAVSAALVAALLLGGCSLTGGTLGGREKCWDASQPRIASLMKGNLRLDPSAPRLDTPEGETLPLSFVGLQVASGANGAELVDSGGSTVALDGELVTLWGGVAGDASMVVCAVEERHGSGFLEAPDEG